MFYSVGGRIDHGHHDGYAVRAINDAVAMNKAVARAAEIIDKGNQTLTHPRRPSGQLVGARGKKSAKKCRSELLLFFADFFSSFPLTSPGSPRMTLAPCSDNVQISIFAFTYFYF